MWITPKAVGAEAVQDLCRAALPPTEGHPFKGWPGSEVKDRESQGGLTPEQTVSTL